MSNPSSSSASSSEAKLKPIEAGGQPLVRDLIEADPFAYGSWMFASVNDPEHSDVQHVEPFELADLRDSLDPAPDPVEGDCAQLWGVDFIDGRAHIAPIGVSYATDDGIVLVSSLPTQEPLSWLAKAVPATVPVTTGCPTKHFISGTGSYTTATYRSRDAARHAGDAVADDRASTDAGLQRNAFTCPNAACRRKRVTTVRVGRTRTTHVSLYGSVGWGEWRYYASGRYSWTATIVCL